VLDQVGRDARLADQAPAEQQVYAHARGEVEAELEAVEPRFERRFGTELQQRIDHAHAPGLWDRLKMWWQEQGETWRHAGMGLAATAAVFVLFFVATPSSIRSPGPMIDGPDANLPATAQLNAEAPATVSVEELSFDGTAVVMQNEDVTVVFLSES
jgi:hypothetical protein